MSIIRTLINGLLLAAYVLVLLTLLLMLTGDIPLKAQTVDQTINHIKASSGYTPAERLFNQTLYAHRQAIRSHQKDMEEGMQAGIERDKAILTELTQRLSKIEDKRSDDRDITEVVQLLNMISQETRAIENDTEALALYKKSCEEDNEKIEEDDEQAMAAFEMKEAGSQQAVVISAPKQEVTLVDGISPIATLDRTGYTLNLDSSSAKACLGRCDSARNSSHNSPKPTEVSITLRDPK